MLGSLLEDIVPVAFLYRRPQSFEGDAGFRRDLFVRGGVAIARGIGVRGAVEDSVGCSSHSGEDVLDRQKRRRAHTAARRGVERVRAHPLDCGEAERVDRSLRQDEISECSSPALQSEQNFRPSLERAPEAGPADLDVADPSRFVVVGDQELP